MTHEEAGKMLEGSIWYRPGKETHLARCLCHGRWAVLEYRQHGSMSVMKTCRLAKVKVAA